MSNRAAAILGLVLLFALSGCSARDHATPDTGLASHEVMQAYSLDREWWKGYGDAQLDALVARALRDNVDLAKSAVSVNLALYQANMLGADLVPAFSGGANAGSTTNTVSGVAGRSYGGNAGVSYELDLWGRLRRSRSAQLWEYEATREDLESARLALINNVVKAYCNLMYLRQAEDVTRRGLDFHEHLFGIVEEKFRVGAVDGLELMTARQSFLSERGSLLDLEQQSKSAEQTLRNLLNLRPEEALDLAPVDLLTMSGPPVDLDVPVSALGHRPDVRAAEDRLQKAFDALGAERAGLYPSLTLGGTLSVSSDEADGMFDLPLLGGTIRINFPFLQWNRTRWNIKSHEAGLEEAEFNFIQKVNSALNEVDGYYFAYGNALSQLEIINAKHEADAEISRYRKARYEAGVDELRDWLQARNTENSSRLAMIRAKYSVIENENAIYQALGGRLTAK